MNTTTTDYMWGRATARSTEVATVLADLGITAEVDELAVPCILTGLKVGTATLLITSPEAMVYLTGDAADNRWHLQLFDFDEATLVDEGRTLHPETDPRTVAAYALRYLADQLN